jgi:hypothetical protein
LGVAFSFVFIDDNGAQLRQRGARKIRHLPVWFNNGFTWSIGVVGKGDLQSVILHEFGHTLNLGHFGILRRSPPMV